MKKTAFFITITLILFAVQQTYAVSENANAKSVNNPSTEKKNENSQKNQVLEIIEVTPSLTIIPEVSPTVTNTPVVYKNHGQYVSSVAKTHPGGKVVSEAARSDIGKKKAKITPSVTLTPSVSPTITPSITLSPSPTATVTPSVTLSPTPTDTVGPIPNEQINSLIVELKELIKSLKSIFRF